MTPPLSIPGSPTRGWLVLIGGGEFSFGETAEIDQFLLSKLPTGRRRIAFIPAASGSTEYAAHLGSYFKGHREDVEFVNVPIYRPRDARREKNLAVLRDAGMVYLGGGVTNALLEAIVTSPVSEVMKEVLEYEGVIAAIGAAASCFGTFASDMRGSGSPLPALDWIPRSVVEAGFDPANDTRLRRMMSLENVEIGLGIPPKTALAIAPDRTGTILGSGNVAVVRKPAASPA